MKILYPILAGAALLCAACMTDPEQKTLHQAYSVGPEYPHEDSTTWTDTSEIQCDKCVIYPIERGDPRPPSPSLTPILPEINAPAAEPKGPHGAL